MRFHYRRRNEVHAVDITDLGGGRHRVRWSRSQGAAGQPGDVLEEREMELAVATTPAGYAVMAGHDVHVARVERYGDQRVVTLGGRTLELEWLDPFRATARGGGAGATGPRKVTSPMPGRVVAVPVTVGDEIAAGATVIVVEAMKMANELRSPIAGRVTAVRAAVGDVVESGSELVVVTPRDDVARGTPPPS